MTDMELELYMLEKQQCFGDPNVLKTLIAQGEELLTQECSLTLVFEAIILFEFLCFTLHIAEGRAIYLKLIDHIAERRPDLAEKYWKIYDDLENLPERYRM